MENNYLDTDLRKETTYQNFDKEMASCRKSGSKCSEVAAKWLDEHLKNTENLKVQCEENPTSCIYFGDKYLSTVVVREIDKMEDPIAKEMAYLMLAMDFEIISGNTDLGDKILSAVDPLNLAIMMVGSKRPNFSLMSESAAKQLIQNSLVDAGIEMSANSVIQLIQTGEISLEEVLVSGLTSAILSTSSGTGKGGQKSGTNSITEGKNLNSNVSKGDTNTKDITEISTASGNKGDWNKELNTPKPNHIYKVDNDKVYMTDDIGRVKEVDANLTLNTKDRNTYQQCKTGKCGGKTDDDGGHLIASIFNGPGEKLNLIPQNSNLNRGAWKNMEKEWAKALKEGKEVKVNIKPVYTGNSSRPDSFKVSYSIDGKIKDEIFNNAIGGK